MENCKGTKKLPRVKDILAKQHISDYIALSGDVHPNPGPKKKNKANTSNIIQIILIFMFILCQIETFNMKRQREETLITNMRFCFENSPWRFNKEIKYSNCKYKKKIFNKHQFLIIMLLLSGDIENPGPKISCSYCNESITTDSITCDQCNETKQKNK